MASFDIETNAAFSPYLLAGESIKWSGRPRSGLMTFPNDAYFIPFSLLWCGFAIFWTITGVLHWGLQPMFALGCAFVLLGLFMVFGRFFADAWLRQATHYAVSDQRILILRTRPLTKLRTVLLSQICETTLTLHAAEFGSIRFVADLKSLTNPFRNKRAPESMIPSLSYAPMFIAIDNAGEVYRLIQDLLVR
ncbi:hypothetical protein [Oryzibacter oryziterrae]|uniref:hypothetical protein n=1 Tax=Oryzibacter oryziterrae TaxID=2766474 RepID=UPI001F164310|nr:hypothetical protein [Oryzibacter oryziterrae]